MLINTCFQYVGQKVRAITFNRNWKEIAALTLNGYIHVFDAETFNQKISRKLPSCQDLVCLATQESGLYAIGCKSYTLLLDCRTLQPIKKITSRYNGCGIRSASFQGNLLTIGTGLGQQNFAFFVFRFVFGELSLIFFFIFQVC